MKKINIYYVFDVLLALSILFLFLSRKHVNFLYGSFGAVVITGILVLLEMKEKTQLTPTIVKNDSDNNVLYKPENDSTLKELKPHTSVEGVDGIKVSGKVFKACSGTHVVINGDDSITTKSITGKIANTIRGGYITSSPDAGWDDFFPDQD